MATGPANLPAPETITTATVCDLFLDHSQKNHSPACYENYRHFLRAFVDAYGRSPAAELKPFHVTKWLDDHPSWKGGRRHAVIAVKRAFSWAEQQRGHPSLTARRKVAARPIAAAQAITEV
jgi:hypothetical protein